MQNVIALLILLLAITTFAQKSLLQSGPMLGATEMRESMLWVQTTKSAQVKFVYWDKEKPAEKFETKSITTREEDAFAATLIADKVEPGRVYGYKLYINNKPVDLPYRNEFKTLKLWQWREDPPEINFVAGSCAYINETRYDRPGKPYGSEYEIYTSVYNKKPDFMVWMGDNMYLREVDWNTRTGILKRSTHTRSLPELQPLFGSVHNYAIWDDHDFGPNNSDMSYIHKEKTLEAFKLFWPMPSYGINGKPGITSSFQWGDTEFFMLDNRYYRTPNDRKTGKREMFGDEQIQWLINALVNSSAPFKFVVSGGQMLNPVAKYENYSTYPEEQAKLLSLIKEENIPGVIFLSGDRHHSEITKMERQGTYPLYDITSSSLTAGVFTLEENNQWRVGEPIKQHNFALFNISGPRKDRVLKCTFYDKDGKEIRSINIKASELK